jgi:hypothetical protein
MKRVTSILNKLQRNEELMFKRKVCIYMLSITYYHIDIRIFYIYNYVFLYVIYKILKQLLV